jgi:hydroxypyruvate isomerase
VSVGYLRVREGWVLHVWYHTTVLEKQDQRKGPMGEMKSGERQFQFAANIGDGWMWSKEKIVDRIALAAQAGFTAVEAAFPYDYDTAAIREALQKHNMKWVLVNTPKTASLGYAAIPGMEKEFRESFETAFKFAQEVGCPRIHVMAGKPNGSQEVYVENMRYAAAQVAGTGIKLMIEPLNAVDMPGYFVSTTAKAVEMLELISRDNVYMQFDAYHAQMTEGNITAKMTNYWKEGKIDHVQVSCVPGRNEPHAGELDMNYFLNNLVKIGYSGYVGLEYIPKDASVVLENLKEMQAWARANPLKDSAETFGRSN